MLSQTTAGVESFNVNKDRKTRITSYNVCYTKLLRFLFMTYYNILFKYGVEEFISRAYDINIKGFIIPDLPPEEGKDYLEQVKKRDLAPIQIFAPTSTLERMQLLAGNGAGFIYCSYNFV